MTLEEETATTERFAREHPRLHAWGFDGVSVYPPWAWVVLGALLLLFVCRA